MRTLFDEQLNLLHTSMVSMGTLCEDAIAMAAKALEEKDTALAVIKMVNDSIDAFLHADVEEAGAVIRYDDVVDRCFDTVKSELIDRLKSDASCREDVVDILMIAKYLERIGDHAVNVAKWALFSLTGEWEE